MLMHNPRCAATFLTDLRTSSVNPLLLTITSFPELLDLYDSEPRKRRKRGKSFSSVQFQHPPILYLCATLEDHPLQSEANGKTEGSKER